MDQVLLFHNSSPAASRSTRNLRPALPKDVIPSQNRLPQTEDLIVHIQRSFLLQHPAPFSGRRFHNIPQKDGFRLPDDHLKLHESLFCVTMSKILPDREIILYSMYTRSIHFHIWHPVL